MTGSDRTHVEAAERPPAVLAHEHLRDPEPAINGVPLVLASLRPLADGDGGVAVSPDVDVAPVDGAMTILLAGHRSSCRSPDSGRH
jgi:hypothetical protein